MFYVSLTLPKNSEEYTRLTSVGTLSRIRPFVNLSLKEVVRRLEIRAPFRERERSATRFLLF